MAEWMDELERLGELRNKSYITDEEFDAERKLILPSEKGSVNIEDEQRSPFKFQKKKQSDFIPSSTEIEPKENISTSKTDTENTEASSRRWILVVTAIGFAVPAAYDRPVTMYDHMLSGFTAFLVCVVILALSNLSKKVSSRS